MSAGDVVCTGWLIKSPPEKKLKRFAWRKRWFVLRRGRMSGNPDVLEYYQSKSSKKPIRTIDLKECEVEMLNGQLRIKRDFHGKHLFVVKTSSRVFYLVAKTEEEMNGWITSISQICHFGSAEEAESSEEGSLLSPASVQPSPDGSDRTSISSQPDSAPLMDYLLLSQCKTGSVSTNGYDSFSTSDISLEQKSLDDTFRDIWTESSSSSISHPSPPSFAHRRSPHSPFSAPCSFSVLPSSSSSPLRPCINDVFQFDKPFSSASFEPAGDLQTPPPLPPKPGHLSEQLSDGGALRAKAMSSHLQLHGNVPLSSRRTSLSSLDHLRIVHTESRLFKNRRQSVNLPCLSSAHVQGYQDESYVPMTSPSATTVECDGYIPMSPRAHNFLGANCSGGSSSSLSSLVSQPGDFVPPPVHRHLKPRVRKARPPPLDLTGLSTITECPTHLPVSRQVTGRLIFRNLEKGYNFSASHLPFEGRYENGDVSRDELSSRSTMESRQFFCVSFDGTGQSWMSSPTRLDYLSLDFNSATPSPVQKKPLLTDEYRVDYVKVDEKKTQALQNTKMEWTDVRLSKT